MARSGLERRIEWEMDDGGHVGFYEACRIPYLLRCHYVPDWVLLNGIVIEAKGYFTSADRRKMRAVKEAHPELEIRFVFGRAANKLNKTSRTSYSKWAGTKGFPWADRSIPGSWYREPPFKESIATLAELGVSF